MNEEERQEYINQLREAQEKMYDALCILRGVAKDTHDRYHMAYIVDHLAIMTNNGHDFLSRDPNIDTWVEQLENADVDELEEAA